MVTPFRKDYSIQFGFIFTRDTSFFNITKEAIRALDLNCGFSNERSLKIKISEHFDHVFSTRHCIKSVYSSSYLHKVFQRYGFSK